MLLAVQLNHPGKEKPFKIGSDYRETVDGKVIRMWNDKNPHCRKFIMNQGQYLEIPNSSVPKYSSLLFWG
jgi:hypothetical protein